MWRGSSGLYQANEASDDPVIYSSSVFEMKRYQRLTDELFSPTLNLWTPCEAPQIY